MPTLVDDSVVINSPAACLSSAMQKSSIFILCGNHCKSITEGMTKRVSLFDCKVFDCSVLQKGIEPGYFFPSVWGNIGIKEPLSRLVTGAF